MTGFNPKENLWSKIDWSIHHPTLVGARWTDFHTLCQWSLAKIYMWQDVCSPSGDSEGTPHRKQQLEANTHFSWGWKHLPEERMGWSLLASTGSPLENPSIVQGIEPVPSWDHLSILLKAVDLEAPVDPNKVLNMKYFYIGLTQLI